MVNLFIICIYKVLGRIKLEIINKLNINGNTIFENYKNKNTINALNSILNETKNCRSKYKSLLLDGGFYNLGYFYRLQLLRSALKSGKTKEHAFIWDCNIKVCKNLLNSIGIDKIFFLEKISDHNLLAEADYLSQQINSKKDLISIKLPHLIPGAYLYDMILKIQRKATVDITDKNLKEYIYKFLCWIKFSEDLLNKCNPDIVILSHSISYQCTPMAWLSSKRKIPTIISGGDFGIPRLWKIINPHDIYYGTGRPTKKDFKIIPNDKKSSLILAGKKYIINRISGKSSDIGAKYAFQGRRDKISKLGIDQKKYKKIISIYSACFFDFPHCYGMKRFTDMLDWLQLTIRKASLKKDVLWLLKPHPMEQWYGGVKLSDIVKNQLPENIVLLPYNYSGKDVLEISDGLITFHGTSAIEYAAMGKAVLVADRGWYHDCEFVLFPKSREDYSNLLTKNWFELINFDKAKKNAMLFAGLFYGIPTWQKNCILPDDSDKKLLRAKLPYLIKNKRKIIKKEIKLMKKWINSESKFYHNFKIENSKIFTNLI